MLFPSPHFLPYLNFVSGRQKNRHHFTLSFPAASCGECMFCTSSKIVLSFQKSNYPIRTLKLLHWHLYCNIYLANTFFEIFCCSKKANQPERVGRKTTGLRPKGYDRRVAEGRLKNAFWYKHREAFFVLSKSKGERNHEKKI